MTDFNEEMSKILGIYGHEQLCSLFDDTYELIKLYNVDENDDWVKDIVGAENVWEARVARTAYLLSRLAHNHADLLKRVKRVAPGFYQRAEKFSKPLALNDA